MGEVFLNVISRLFYILEKAVFANGLLSFFSLVPFSSPSRKDWRERQGNGRKEMGKGLLQHPHQTPEGMKPLFLWASLCSEVGAMKWLMDRTSPGGQRQVEQCRGLS